MNIQLNLNYKQEKLYKKRFGKNLAFEIAFGRKFLKVMRQSFPKPLNDVPSHDSSQ